MMLDNLLLVIFAAGALVCALLMLVLQQPMRVAIALICAMISLGGIYGLLGVHFIAAFQVLIYVGAVMVFMVYVIMLMDPREALFGRYSKHVIGGVIGLALLLAALWISIAGPIPAARAHPGAFRMVEFAAAFLREYWLHFELTSVLLLAGVVAALAVIKVSRKPHG